MANNANQIQIGSNLLSLIVFICLSLVCDTESCLTGLKTVGVTSPTGDIKIEYGNELVILCILNETYVQQEGKDVIKNFIFKRNNETLPDALTNILDNRTLQLHIQKPPPSESMYYCVDRRNDDTVCFNNVLVGTKPSEITDFSCVGRNYVNLTCSWTAPKNYVVTNYTLEYYFPGRSSRSHFHCPKIEPKNFIPRGPTKMKCYWDLSTHPLYRQTQGIYYFKLISENVFGHRSMNYNFSHFANVIPDAPTNLTILEKTTKSILLQWNIPFHMRMFPPGVIHRIQYQCEYDSDKTWKIADTSILPHKNTTYTFKLADLPFAHALYDIRISLRSAKSDEDYETNWSHFTSITSRTKSKLPGSPPKINMGSFEVFSRLDVRDITIYWQYIPVWMKNGENLTYQVVSLLEDNVEKWIVPTEITNTYAKFVGLSNKSFKFTIATVNEIGQSKNVSSIFVPAYEERIPEPTVLSKIAFNITTYELSWLKPSLHHKNYDVDNYTIFWCNNDRDRPYLCKGYLQWIVVPSYIQSHNITVDESEIYQFAISANTKYGSSGMVWTSCTVIPMNGGGVGKMKNLWIDHLGPTFIHVSWKIGCADYVAGIHSFKIYYCPIKSPVELVCKGKQKVLNIDDPNASEGNVTSLKPYTTYMVTVSVITKHNSNTLQSEPLYNTTLEATPDSPPQSITVKNVTNSSITLTWLPPFNVNGVLKLYEITYSSIVYGMDKKIVDPQLLTYTLNNLRSYTEYTISIKACTVGCSAASEPIKVKTAVTVPGQIRQPNVNYLNITLIQISWMPPDFQGGDINSYELKIREKTTSGNTTQVIKTTDLSYTISNCYGEETYKVLYFSVRAINIDSSNNTYVGPWSSERENYCQAGPKYLNILIIGLVSFVVMIFMIACGIKSLWQRCKKMRDIDIKLPGNLETQLTTMQWTATTKDPSNKNNTSDLDPGSDDQRLLDTKVDSVMNGDSSGCSSCQDSVHSSLASGSNLSAGTDSGTEQPKSTSNDDAVSKADSSSSREGSLRLRKTVTQTPNYCVLGVGNTGPKPETNTSSGYVPIPKTNPYIQVSDIKKPVTHSPYVIAVDSKQLVAKDKPQTSELGYSSIVPTSTLINIDQCSLNFGQPMTSGGDSSGPYVKTDWTSTQPEPPANDYLLHNSYCRLGIDGKSVIPKMPLAESSDLITENLEEPIQKTSTRVSDSVKGYVPHKHFDSKMLKGD